MRCGCGQQGHGVGPNGKEGHISQVEQAGQTHHDIQAQAEQNVDADCTDGIVPVLAGAQGHQEDQQQAGSHR